jgi:transposase
VEIYIGLDVHAQSTTMAVVGADGQRLGLRVLETTREALTSELAAVAGTKHVCFEEGTASAWIYEVVSPLVAETVCCQPKKRARSKSDASDAWRLAEDLRRGAVDTRVYKAVGQMGALREAVRGHRLLTQDVARLKNRLRSIYRSRGLPATTSALFEPAHRAEWLAQLPPAHRELAELLHQELDALAPLRDRAEKRLLDESRPHPAIDRLTTIPGIGPIRAAYIVAIVVDPRRFRSKRQFWSYCGLAVVTTSSGDWRRVRGLWVRMNAARPRGLNANRNPWLKEVFKSAALSVTQLKAEHPLRIDYEAMIMRNMRPNLARLTLARRLAATALALWKKQEVYDYSKRHRPPTPRAA